VLVDGHRHVAVPGDHRSVVPFPGELQVHLRGQHEIIQGFAGSSRDFEDVFSDVFANQVRGRIHAVLVHGDHDIVEFRGPRIFLAVQILHPQHVTFVVLVDFLEGILLREAALFHGRGGPVLDVGYNANLQNM
jgi:hypothetical protein